MMHVGDETDLMRLLEVPASAAKVAKFLLAIDELNQFRYMHEAHANHMGETAGGDSHLT